MSKQTKSKQRVKDFGEVFTAEREVKAMCDLVPSEVWENITSKFLEPSCGNGNFLVEIYARKLERCKDERDGLKALASIVGIDILPDNVIESRVRLKKMFDDKFPKANSFCRQTADLILQNNIICGDSLKIMEQWQGEAQNS
jgi:hypothetical protein